MYFCSRLRAGQISEQMQQTDFLSELNPPQREAVCYTAGPSLVIAGAGSGKTRVLTYKIVYLLQQGFAPEQILALTFTNKAAREMKERIAALTDPMLAARLHMGTFHAICARILRNEAGVLGYTSRFSIYDTSDTRSLIRSIIKELQLDDKVYKPALIQARISSVKNQLISPEAYLSSAALLKADNDSRIPRCGDIYRSYAARCRQADAMDFDDLLMQSNCLFRDHPEILDKYRQSFAYILVDEYQDTNFAQYLLLRKLAEEHERICVVGDDAQSIYSFRGAQIDNILHFRNNYRKVAVFKLEQNYRSTQTIVEAANSLIAKNSKQIRKTIFSQNPRGEAICVNTYLSGNDEAEAIAKQIRDLGKSEPESYKKVAVLYRTKAQSRLIEEALRKYSIPYRVYGAASFYQHKEVKDVVAYCRLVCNPRDEEAFKRIVNTPARGIGDTTLAKITEAVRLHNVSHWDILADPLAYNLKINGATATRLAKFRDLIEAFVQQAQTQDAYQLVSELLRSSGMLATNYNQLDPEELSRRQNIEEMLSAIHNFSEASAEEGKTAILADFLAEVALLSDQDTDDKNPADSVTLMTVHAAKGLEFPTVFIAGMEEELFPSPLCTGNLRELEEERRLFYVAITRAEKRCFISHANSRFRNGQTNFAKPSRFIRDIDPAFLKFEDHSKFTQNSPGSVFIKQKTKAAGYYGSPASETGRPKSLTKLPTTSERTEAIPLTIEHLPVGAFVKHDSFGIGKILSTTLDNGNPKAQIDFGEKGVKFLLLKFARLQVLK